MAITKIDGKAAREFVNDRARQLQRDFVSTFDEPGMQFGVIVIATAYNVETTRLLVLPAMMGDGIEGMPEAIQAAVQKHLEKRNVDIIDVPPAGEA